VVSRRIRFRQVRLLALATAALVGLVLVPATSGQAAPIIPAAPSAAEARRMHATLADKMTKATEDYNTAGVLLARARAREAALRGQAAAQQAHVKSYESEVAEFAASAYRGGRFDVVASLLQSGSPQRFLDQMSTLDNLSRAQRAQINRLIEARRTLHEQQKQIASAVAAQRQSQQTLKTRRSAIEKDLKTWAALDVKLNPKPNRTRRSGGVYTGPASGDARVALNAAYAKLGKPYKWGAEGPNSFDCSGLTMYAWGKAGVRLPHSSRMQYSSGRKVSTASLRAGDLLYSYRPISHVAMYVGNGKMITAPRTGDVVKIAPVRYGDLVGATRP